ncbi:MAG: chromate transporter [Clostridiales bacterium]|nr:chromate transporter [Clostridiales bacterium]
MINSLVLRMCLSFIKIGAFCFGGGYAAIGLIQSEVVEKYAWLTEEQFINIIAVAEMTPGPIAVNTSTFTGYLMSGAFAGVLCTFCVILIPSLLALLMAFFFERAKKNDLVKVAVKGIRPAAIGIIAAAGIGIAKGGFVDYYSLLFFGVAALIIFVFKKSPIIALLASGALGVLLYGFIL